MFLSDEYFGVYDTYYIYGSRSVVHGLQRQKFSCVGNSSLCIILEDKQISWAFLLLLRGRFELLHGILVGSVDGELGGLMNMRYGAQV